MVLKSQAKLAVSVLDVLLMLMKGEDTSESIQPKLTRFGVQKRSIFGPVVEMRQWNAEPCLRPGFVAKLEIKSSS